MKTKTLSTYEPQQIEKKWQKEWSERAVNAAKDFSEKEKQYILVEFPYPSGAGLHVGHVWGYTMSDVIARYMRMNGKNVLFPMGWDAFGLPAENYAIRTGIHPKVSTTENIKNFREQLDRMGFSFDWGREVNTSDPTYYKWTQWIFLQLFKKGLAYEADVDINWCPFCKTGLANEEVTSESTHERCGTKVSKKKLRQWMLKITQYADRLIEDLSDLDFSDDIKHQQINWIGRSEGVVIRFPLVGDEKAIDVFTTRADTLPGVTFLVLSPEHPLLSSVTSKEQKNQVKVYCEKVLSDLDSPNKEKTGVFTGGYVEHPLTKEQIPVWVSNYVLMEYGTGAIMAVPAHDERDGEFAKTYKLPIKLVDEVGPAAATKIVGVLKKKAMAEEKTMYKLRDWVFSRQRYWGEPIPIIHCSQCGVVPVPEQELPVVLPEVENFHPTDDGRSPLAAVREWVEVKCPRCEGPAERETNTMPNWAGSSWYFLRYCDPQNPASFASKDKLDYYLPVDLYLGGAEHTTLHVLYSRFWHKFLFDLGLVPTKEPYRKRRNRGLILGPDGKKMSKSLGNIINPVSVVDDVGADSLRIYELFLGPFQGTFPWNDGATRGVHRFLQRIYKATQLINEAGIEDEDPKVLAALHQTIKSVTGDINELKFNTAVASMMGLLNVVEESEYKLSLSSWKMFLRILAPFAPFLSEELWSILSSGDGDTIESIHTQAWPRWDEAYLGQGEVTVPVQVNGRLRDLLVVQKEGLDQDSIVKLALGSEKVAKYVTSIDDIHKVIYIEGKLLNLVTT